jgi:hypothetical protein
MNYVKDLLLSQKHFKTFFQAEFVTYIKYCRSLKFEDKPDYLALRKLFKDLLVKEGLQCDYVFDWTMKKIQDSIQTDKDKMESDSKMNTSTMNTTQPLDDSKKPKIFSSKFDSNGLEK